jgi:hypothetical protein
VNSERTSGPKLPMKEKQRGTHRKGKGKLNFERRKETLKMMFRREEERGEGVEGWNVEFGL